MTIKLTRYGVQTELKTTTIKIINLAMAYQPITVYHFFGWQKRADYCSNAIKIQIYDYFNSLQSAGLSALWGLTKTYPLTNERSYFMDQPYSHLYSSVSI